MKGVYVSFVLRIGIVIRYSCYWHAKFHWVSGGSGAGVWAWLDFVILAKMVNGMLLGTGVSDHYHLSPLLSIRGLCSLVSWLVASLLGGLLAGIGRV
jgi:hypothetical protein